MTKTEMSAPLVEPADLEVGTGRLWFGLLIGAAAWKLQLMINYALVPFACWHDLGLLIHLASGLMLGVALLGAWVSYGSWKRLGGAEDTDLGGPAGRARFMALSGMATSPFFGLLIVGQWLPNLTLGTCAGIS